MINFFGEKTRLLSRPYRRDAGSTPLEVARPARNNIFIGERKARAPIKTTLFTGRTRSLTGFTLIELLVVTAILAMLLSIIFIRVTEIRAKARDASREERIRQIRNALDLYNVNRLRFPICPEETVINGTTDCLSAALINDGVIRVSVSIDPLGGSTGVCGDPENYVFCYESDDGSNYMLRYDLETDTVNGKSSGWQTTGS